MLLFWVASQEGGACQQESLLLVTLARQRELAGERLGCFTSGQSSQKNEHSTGKYLKK